MKEEIEMGGERKRKMDVGKLIKVIRKYQMEGCWRDLEEDRELLSVSGYIRYQLH